MHASVSDKIASLQAPTTPVPPNTRTTQGPDQNTLSRLVETSTCPAADAPVGQHVDITPHNKSDRTHHQTDALRRGFIPNRRRRPGHTPYDRIRQRTDTLRHRFTPDRRRPLRHVASPTPRLISPTQCWSQGEAFRSVFRHPRVSHKKNTRKSWTHGLAERSV